MSADSQVRGLENQSEIINAFDRRWQPSVRKALQEDWPPLADEIGALLEKGVEEAGGISRVIHRMIPVNHAVLEACLAGLPKYLPADQPGLPEVPSKKRISSRKTPRKQGKLPSGRERG